MSVRVLLLCVCCVLFGGCVNLKPKADRVKLYALGPSELTLPGAPVVGPAIYVARPDLPAYLDGKRLQYRHADGEVRNLAAARWAEPLQEGVARALAEYLSASSDRPVGGFYPWPKRTKGGLELQVQVQRVGASAAGEVEMFATWELRAGSVSVQSGRYQSRGIEWAPGDAESLVAGINQAIRQLAVEVGARL